MQGGNKTLINPVLYENCAEVLDRERTICMPPSRPIVALNRRVQKKYLSGVPGVSWVWRGYFVDVEEECLENLPQRLVYVPGFVLICN
jgi:hypothetical protein